MYALEWQTLSAVMRGLFWCLFPELRSTKITLEWGQEQFITRVHALFYFFHNITNTEITIKMRIFTHHPSVSLAQFCCWWHHNWLLMTSQWPDNCNAIVRIVISNSLDIDFIHSDIHGWSCKNIVCQFILSKGFSCIARQCLRGYDQFWRCLLSQCMGAHANRKSNPRLLGQWIGRTVNTSSSALWQQNPVKLISIMIMIWHFGLHPVP